MATPHSPQSIDCSQPKNFDEVDAHLLEQTVEMKVSTRYYIDVVGFRKDPIDAAGWSFLTRDSFRVMLGNARTLNPRAT